MAKIKTFITCLFGATFLRFIFVGALNTLFGTAIMFLTYNLLLYPYDWGYWLSTAANYLFGSVLSYFLNKHLTFRNTEKGIGPVIRFTVNIGICYGIAYGLAKPAINLLLSGGAKKLQENIAMLTGMVVFMLLNYFGQKFFAFRKK